jgi:ATP-binding cassette subfamily A (ABC1) protein 3
MKTPAFENYNAAATTQLMNNFPTFMMFTFLIPFYYIVSKLAEEKESKIREGMKMMGLKDSIYYLSWFIFFFTLMFVMSIIISLLIGFSLFIQSNFFLIFMMSLLYGISLFGESVVIVALLPNVRSSATAATLFHVISYFLIYTIQNPQIPFLTKIMASLLPNIAMSFTTYNLFYFELQSDGINYTTTNQYYGNYLYTEGLLMLLADLVIYMLIGTYLD